MKFQRERVWRGGIPESTNPNYYKETKLFCEMNDIVLTGRKILCGLPRAKQAANERALLKGRSNTSSRPYNEDDNQYNGFQRH
jgi:hypothetical protein